MIVPAFKTFDEAKEFYYDTALSGMNFVHPEKFCAYLYLMANGFRSYPGIVKGYIRESEYFEPCCNGVSHD